MAHHRLYLAPGMFGFGRLASFDYFGHVERELGERFAAAGAGLEIHVADVRPTASVRRRAQTLAQLIERTCGDDRDPIHLLGHSTGGLDVRLVASPGAVLPTQPRWLDRLRSVTMMNTPHYGTPLATFFATTRGQQALYVMSAMTFLGLSLGTRPLGILRGLLALLAPSEGAIGIKLPLIEPLVRQTLATLDDARSPEVREYLSAIESDQGAMIQLTPEGMDLVLAGFLDRAGVRYQSTASMAPSPTLRSWLGTVGNVGRAGSLALFTAVHAITARYDERYPCSAMSQHAGQPAASEAAEAMFTRAFGEAPGLADSDGVVPIRSQLWGELVWAGWGDHLDVLGHYRDRSPETEATLRHHDWMTSGSSFDDLHFGQLMDTIASGMLG
jgi:triacylglycerol lipase